MTLLEKQHIFSINVAKLIIQSKETFGIDISLGEAWRTIEQQQI
jgi:hypothetical protein